ncbi:hypothetical protein Syun_021630 [Stephania yunnanensis]|uniref:Protein kinase domain-containing protein n=1 Tax=Stephania yunnanensis TaxID=152371 RepID=A0AAP0NPX1_9MAGN
MSNSLCHFPTLPHLNPFLVVLSGHRSALQRTLDLLGENKRDDSLVKKRRERAYLVSADCRADSPPCSRTEWMKKAKRMMEERKMRRGSATTASRSCENTWYGRASSVRDRSAIKDDAKLERCFDLEDLLRASAEVLGKGSVGTSYKAVLEEGTAVVVKRLKDVVVTKREFEVQMEGLRKVNHENIVPLRAFYYSKDEKLLVYDFMPAGSLSALLHLLCVVG